MEERHAIGRAGQGKQGSVKQAKPVNLALARPSPGRCLNQLSGRAAAPAISRLRAVTTAKQWCLAGGSVGSEPCALPATVSGNKTGAWPNIGGLKGDDEIG
ncbi:hypothetical protein GGTG_06521 [Gaeumannomyces tritici R3-111a-1]|uniref:Uncharacterized protein n=1 Tax=Gaeumannomyces tritici (strain R3-111a-1) TaxID=644352 RepID=J3NZ21_GAET3|nr:hypothetical protein GGTG_06521 [Gaeumannomyces tritici R3-111a-1]EJT76604.1 hypothetical protein GGTG_06521 [Gaeumannomyces tritici R3-111a-1]